MAHRPSNSPVLARRKAPPQTEQTIQPEACGGFNPFLKLGIGFSLRVSIEIWRQDQTDESLRWLLVGIENSTQFQSLTIT